MARGRHYAKLSLSNAARLSFSDLCILLFMFLSLCRLCVCVFLCSHWSLVDVPLIFFCPADHVPDWQPRVLLGMVEARSVNVKKTTTTLAAIYVMTIHTHTQYILLFVDMSRLADKCFDSSQQLLHWFHTTARAKNYGIYSLFINKKGFEKGL